MIWLPDPDKNDRNIYIHFHLPTQPFWKRLKHGIKYIFGYKSKFGDFDEIILDQRHYRQLVEASEYLAPEKLDYIEGNTLPLSYEPRNNSREPNQEGPRKLSGL